MSHARLLADFKARIEKFVECYLANYKPFPDRDRPEPRIIHDPVWGSNEFFSWEVAILDSPLLQRLRLVKQVGFAHLVYPAARHSRFDHTLGVVSVVSRIVRGLNSKRRGSGEAVDKKTEYALRMAAVLHDVGHCLLSHVAERIYSRRPEYRAAALELSNRYHVSPKPHEVMSYYIIKSRRFVEFFKEIKRDPLIADETFRKYVHLDFIAKAIIGYWDRSRPLERFHVEIINGPLDADKLDYLARDAQFAGLSVVYDFNRYMVTVRSTEESFVGLDGEDQETQSLRLPMKGATSLEQILISKMMLYSYLYHQQKALSAEAMLLEFFEPFSRGETLRFGSAPVEHPVDLLYLTDESLEGLLHPSAAALEEASDLPRRLALRRLVKRALVISRLFVVGLEYASGTPQRDNAVRGFTEMDRCMSSPDGRREFRGKLVDLVRTQIDDADKRNAFHEESVLISWPKPPDVSEAEHMIVPFEHDGGEPTALTKLFPLREWAYSYAATQWKGYVFCQPGYRAHVQEAAIQLIKDTFGIEMSDEAKALSGVPSVDEKLSPQPHELDEIPPLLRLLEESD